jgi:hypothetical protein
MLTCNWGNVQDHAFVDLNYLYRLISEYKVSEMVATVAMLKTQKVLLLLNKWLD